MGFSDVFNRVLQRDAFGQHSSNNGLQDTGNAIVTYFMNNGFSEKDAMILHSAPSTVLIELGEKLTIDLFKLYKEGNLELFVNKIEKSFFDTPEKEFSLNDIGKTYEQLRTWLKGKRLKKIIESTQDKAFSLLNIRSSLNKNTNKTCKLDILQYLHNISSDLYFSDKSMSGQDLRIYIKNIA